MAKELKTLTLQAPAGGHQVSNANLAYANVITVKRNGIRQYPISTTPTGSEPLFKYDSGLGKLIFSTDVPFNFSELDENGARIIEYIFIIYTTGVAIGTPSID